VDALRRSVVSTMWITDDPRNIADAVVLLDDTVEPNRSSAVDFLRKVVLHLPPTDSSEMAAAKAREAEDVRFWKQWWKENREHSKAPEL
jgi:hypothetical protein